MMGTLGQGSGSGGSPMMQQMPQAFMPCGGCTPGGGTPLASFQPPAVDGVQRQYMHHIVTGMKVGNLFQVASNLEAAVKSQVTIPPQFLRTVQAWMKSRATSDTGFSHMQLAQFIGANSYNNQVKANMQQLSQQAVPQPAYAPPASAPPPTSPVPSPCMGSAPFAPAANTANPMASAMYVPSPAPQLPNSPMYVESPMPNQSAQSAQSAASRDLRRPALPAEPGPAKPLPNSPMFVESPMPAKSPQSDLRRPAEPAVPPKKDGRKPAEPAMPPRSSAFRTLPSSNTADSSSIGYPDVPIPTSSVHGSSAQASPQLSAPPPAPPGRPPPWSAAARSSGGLGEEDVEPPTSSVHLSACSATEATPRLTGEVTPTADGGGTPGLFGASTPSVMPTDSVPTIPRTAVFDMPPSTATTATLPTSTQASTANQPTLTSSVPPHTATVASNGDEPPELPEQPVEARKESHSAPMGSERREGLTWWQGKRRGIKVRGCEEIANFLLSGENDYATFRQICLSFNPPADTQQIRAVVQANPQRFTVEGDKVRVVDADREMAVNNMVKKLVGRQLGSHEKFEVEPNKACAHIWEAAHHAMKATPCRVAQVLVSVGSACLSYPGKAEKGLYPANMPLALACLVDRIVYLDRKRGGKLMEKALSPALYDILFRRWMIGRIKGSQFLANMLLLWKRLDYFHADDLDDCMEAMYILVAYARSDGVPDPPDKDEGLGWYKIAAREPNERENTEPICSREELEVLQKQREEEDRKDRELAFEEMKHLPENRRGRVLHAMAQMGLGEEEAKPSDDAMPKAPADKNTEVETEKPPPSALFEDLDEEALFGSALYPNSALWSDDEEEEAIFGSPVGADTPSEHPGSPAGSPPGTPPSRGAAASNIPPSPHTPEDLPRPAASSTQADAFRQPGAPTTPDAAMPASSSAGEKRKADELGATQQYASQASQASQEGGSLPATQAYQDESPKRRRTSALDE